MSDPKATEFEGLSSELRAFWRQIPDKGFFLVLLGAWMLPFFWLGNATLGYVNAPSLYFWMYSAYAATNEAQDDNFCFYIPYVVLGLLWWKRKELLAQPTRTWLPGLAMVALALLTHYFAYAVQQPRASILALFLGIYGLMGLTWGPKILRACVFPFCLLIFMIPLGSLTQYVAFPLQLWVCKIVSFTCTEILGITVIRTGTQLANSTGSYQYDVAIACSGIRSLMAVGMMSIAYAFICFKPYWKRALLIASAVPFAVMGNALRLFVIVMSGEFGGQSVGKAVHDDAILSILPYVPPIIGLILLGRLLEKREVKPPSVGKGLNQPATAS